MPAICSLRTRLVAVLTLFALVPAGIAAAGAWTQRPGAAFLSVSGSYFQLDGDDPYEEGAFALYGEYGALDWLTLGGAVEVTEPVGESADEPGEVSLAAFARARLHTGAAGDPVSVQLGVIAPFGDELAQRPAQIARTDPEIDARLLYGRGFSAALGDGWIGVEAGFRARTGPDADEFRLDLTAGLRPAPRWLVFVQSFNTIGLANADEGGDDFDVYKLAPSVGYEIADGVTMTFGVEREIAGRNIDRGMRFRLGVWTSF